MRDVIVIPTYNERENIGSLVRSIHSSHPDVYILVVDDNSPDGTAFEVEAAKKEIPNLELFLRPKKEGLGKAYIASFKKVLQDPSVRSVCVMDADFSHSVRYLATMFEEIGSSDVVVGSRYVRGGGVEGYGAIRRMISVVSSLYCRIIFPLPIKDYTSGFLCIKTDLLKRVDLERIESSGFAFLIELKYRLWKKGARFKEFPILLKNREEGKSKIGKNIVLEGLLLPWRLFLKDCCHRTKGLFYVFCDAIKKRGIFFIFYWGPKVFYRTYIKRKGYSFIFQNKRYNYFCHLYNCTCLNERAVEIPIVWEMIKNSRGRKILEVGNVLSHYYDFKHDIVDKYERGCGVINEDIADFQPKEKYDLIVSISTLEHVERLPLAMQNLKDCLNPGGKIIATLCLGYNPEVDKLLKENRLGFDRQYFLKRVSSDNIWQEVNYSDVEGIDYNYRGWTANGLVAGLIEN